MAQGAARKGVCTGAASQHCTSQRLSAGYDGQQQFQRTIYAVAAQAASAMLALLKQDLGLRKVCTSLFARIVSPTGQAASTMLALLNQDLGLRTARSHRASTTACMLMGVNLAGSGCSSRKLLCFS